METTTETDALKLREGLRDFYGTAYWYRHGLNRHVTFTDGVKYFADHAGNGAYWFLDIVATELYAKERKYPFQQIKLISAGGKADIVADDGDGNVFYKRHIDYTDCPEGVWEFYFTDNVILLPSEY